MMRLSTAQFKRITALTNLFYEKGWLSSDDSSFQFKNALDKSILLSSQLNQIQFNLFLSLLNKYIFISANAYNKKIERAINKIPKPLNDDHLFRLAPLIAPKDEGKNKSGPSNIYDSTHIIWPKSNLSKYTMDAFLSIDRLKKAPVPENVFTTIFTDDFIGSGNTLENFMEHYIPHKKTNENICFIAIAAMQSGISKASNLGCQVYYDTIVNKAILDNNVYRNKAKHYETMDSIEKLIKISSDYKLGYKQSEALVSLKRTPNNTLPLFWASNALSGEKWPAPFPR